jgi:hypothetical protein
LAGDSVFWFFCLLEGAWLNAKVISLRLMIGRAAVEGLEREREREREQNWKSDDL